MDIDVVVRAQGGDEAAFAELARGNGRRLHALAVGILRDRDLAEDAVQQALLSIWRYLPTLREPARFDAWSYKLLLRACYAEAKRHRRRPADTFARPADLVTDDATREVVARDQIGRAFERLSPEQRAVVVLHGYLDLPLEEVAAVLEVPAGTVRSRLHRALRAMRAGLEADDRAPAPGSPQAVGRLA